MRKHTHTHTYTHSHTPHTQTHTHIHTYMHTYMHTHTHTYTHAHTCTYTCAHIRHIMQNSIACSCSCHFHGHGCRVLKCLYTTWILCVGAAHSFGCETHASWAMVWGPMVLPRPQNYRLFPLIQLGGVKQCK